MIQQTAVLPEIKAFLRRFVDVRHVGKKFPSTLRNSEPGNEAKPNEHERSEVGERPVNAAPAA